MPYRHHAALRLTAFIMEFLLAPLMFLVLLCGLIGAMDILITPQLLDILPVEKWPMAARILYGLLHLH